MFLTGDGWAKALWEDFQSLVRCDYCPNHVGGPKNERRNWITCNQSVLPTLWERRPATSGIIRLLAQQWNGRLGKSPGRTGNVSVGQRPFEMDTIGEGRGMKAICKIHRSVTDNRMAWKLPMLAQSPWSQGYCYSMLNGGHRQSTWMYSTKSIRRD